MLLQTSDGIACDICGSIHRSEFTYYSMDVQSIVTDSSKMTTGVGATKDAFDVCGICYNKWLDQCKTNLGDLRKNKIKCDLCPQYLSGKFEYFRAIFTKVDVEKGEAEGKFETNLDHQHMDYSMCGKCYGAIKSSINKTTQKKSKDEWS